MKLLEKFLLVILCSVSVITLADTTYRAGLLQSKLNLQNNATGALPTVDLERVPGTVMANIYVPNDNDAPNVGYYNEWTGNTTYYNTQNTTFGYAGQMWFVKDIEYVFGKYFDDFGYVKIGDSVIINNSNWEAFAVGNFTPTRTGWYDVEFRVGDGNGGKGPNGGDWGRDLGLAWNTNGVTTMSPKDSWNKIEDDGSMTFLRCITDETFGTLTDLKLTDTGVDFYITASEASDVSATIYFGSTTGILGDPSSWQNASQTVNIPAGETGVVAIECTEGDYPLFTICCCGEYNGNFEQWTPVVSSGTSATAIISVADVQYTNATCVVTIDSLGTGAEIADLSIEISETPDFAGAIQSIPYGSQISDIGQYSVGIPSLSTNCMYWARAVVVNNLGSTFRSNPIDFKTLLPGTPVCGIEALSSSFTSFTFDLSVSEFGVGGENATISLEVSETEDFSEKLTFGEAFVTSAPIKKSITATNLDPAKTYYVRGKIVNFWGVENFSLTEIFSTTDTPVKMSQISSVSGENNSVVLSISSIEMTPGTTYNVAFYVDGRVVETFENMTTLSSFSTEWSGAKGSEHELKIVVDCLWGEEQYSNEYLTTFIVGSSVVGLDSISSLSTQVLFVGDKIMLPEAIGTEFYSWNTNSVINVNGNVVSTLEPGCNMFRLMANDSITGERTVKETGILIVAPARETIKGGLFVRRVDGNFDWNKAESWERILGTSDYPNNPDDVVMIYGEFSGDRTINLKEDITIGYLGVGDLSTNNRKVTLGSSGSLTFKTSDGTASWIRLPGKISNPWIAFNRPVSMENDLVIDGMCGERMLIDFSSTLTVNEYRLSATRVEWYGGGAEFTDGQFRLYGDVIGSGIIEIYANTLMTHRNVNTKSFTGTWKIMNGPHDGNYGGAGLFLGGTYLYNAKELIIGGAWMSTKERRLGANVKTGWHNGYQYGAMTNEWKNVFPSHVVIDGGRLQLLNEGPLGGAAYNAYVATGIREDYLETDTLEIASGPMGSLVSSVARHHDGTYPNVTSTITNLVVRKGGSVAFDINTTVNAGSAYPLLTNSMYVVNSPEGVWTSPDGSYQVLQFFSKNIEAETHYIAIRDTATGKISLTNSVTTRGSSGNFRVIDKWDNPKEESFPDGTEFISLSLYQERKVVFSEPNATIKILSGYLTMPHNSEFGKLDDPNTESGTLDFGEITGYVYSSFQNNSPAKIGCRIVGSNGLVKSAGGKLEIYQPLDQLSGGVYVNCGSLIMKNAATFGENDVYVYAGGKVSITGQNPFNTRATLYLEERDWLPCYSKLDLATSEEVKVGKLMVNGTSVPRGTYGSSLSNAEFVDDNLFEGTGVIKVLSDDCLQPTIILMK